MWLKTLWLFNCIFLIVRRGVSKYLGGKYHDFYNEHLNSLEKCMLLSGTCICGME